MDLLKWLGTGLLVVAPTVAMAGVDNTADVFYTRVGVDDSVKDDDASGFGVRGVFALADRFFLGGEYQSVASDVDLDQSRLGAGINTNPQEQVVFYGLAEFIRFDYQGSADNGFGVHAGTLIDVSETMSFLLNARVGYVDMGKLAGLEGMVGVVYQFNKQFGALADYRLTYLEDGGVDFDVDELRLGVRFFF